MIALRLSAACLLAAGCGAASPCQPATAGSEAYCAMLCAPNDERASHACPGALPHRTDTDMAAICRAEDGPVPDAITEQLRRQGRPADGPPAGSEPWRAALAALEAPRVRDCGESVGVRWPGPLSDAMDPDALSVVAAIEGVHTASWGQCCALDDEGTSCIRIFYQRGQTDPARLAEALERALAPGAERGLAFELFPHGLTGPRCDADNPLCLPQPYEGCWLFEVDGPRHPSELGHSDGACQSDGECVAAGCGNDCVRWDQTGAGTCEGYEPSAPTFCGCVEGSCTWFTQ